MHFKYNLLDFVCDLTDHIFATAFKATLTKLPSPLSKKTFLKESGYPDLFCFKRSARILTDKFNFCTLYNICCIKCYRNVKPYIFVILGWSSRHMLSETRALADRHSPVTFFGGETPQNVGLFE